MACLLFWNMCALPVCWHSQTDAAVNVPLVGTFFVDTRTRKLVQVDVVSGTVSPLVATALAYNPQCTCRHGVVAHMRVGWRDGN
jgi:hypothetical protein